MGRARRILAVLVGMAALGGASVATEDCGSVPADVDGTAQDANVDHLDAAIDWDATEDVTVPPVQCLCPDGGCFITIDGDGPAQTLRSNSGPAVAHFGIPNAPWAQAYYWQGLSIAGSESPDGGANIQFDIEITENADLSDFRCLQGDMQIVGPGSAYRYAYYTRHDGALFSPTSGTSASVTLTQADPPGGIVAGSYTATVVDSTQPDAAPVSLSGTFLTCRLCDYVGPTPPRP